MAQLPNFLTIETRPFDPETYDEAEVEEIRDEDGKTRVRLRVENTIRWRYKTDDTGGLQLNEDVCGPVALLCVTTHRLLLESDQRKHHSCWVVPVKFMGDHHPHNRISQSRNQTRRL